MEDSCKDVGVLDTKISALATRQDRLETQIHDGIVRLEKTIQDLSSEVKRMIDVVATKTQDQETRLTLIESYTKSQEDRLVSLDAKVDKMSIRMGQIIIIGIAVSLILPVALETWLIQRPSEVAPVAGKAFN